eukprot:6190917-Pleurochrysis_carterae.AAC.2
MSEDARPRFQARRRDPTHGCQGTGAICCDSTQRQEAKQGARRGRAGETRRANRCAHTALTVSTPRRSAFCLHRRALCELLLARKF